MTIDVSNFGDMLMSRPAGREAFLAAKAYMFSSLDQHEKIILDFAHVNVLTPSWADEFLTGIIHTYPQNMLEYCNTSNPTVSTSLQMILEPFDISSLPRIK